MAVSLTGKNYFQISSCDSSSSGAGSWSAGTSDTANKKEGASSISNVMRTGGNWLYTMPAMDLTGYTHLRIWILTTLGGLVETFANGGIRIAIGNASVLGYWYVGGRDTYPGGWQNYVVDLSKAVDEGTKPALNAVTRLGINITLTGAGKNVDNVWVDNLIVCDGYTVSGDDSGDYFDFDDIYDIENNPVGGGYGVLTKKAGVYCMVGSLDVGKANATTKFNAKNQTIVFENRPDKAGTGSLINTSLMGITVVDDGVNTTEFILGNKVGTNGVEGCVLQTQNSAQLAKFFVNASDPDVDNFKLYGSNFQDAGVITMPASNANVDIANCNFIMCDKVLAGTSKIRNCNFISTDTHAIQISTLSFDVKDCNFINCVIGVEITLANDDPGYDFDNLVFYNCTNDIDNTSGGNVVINLMNGSNASTYIGDPVQFKTSITLEMIVTDDVGSPLSGIYVFIDNYPPDLPYILNDVTDIDGKASVGYTGSPVDGAVWRARKYGYKPFNQIIDIGSENISLPITLVVDPQQK